MQFYTGSFWHPVQYLVGWYNRTTWPEVPIGLGNSKSPESHEISWKWRVSPKIQLQILNNLPLPENQLPFTHKPKSPISSHPPNQTSSSATPFASVLLFGLPSLYPCNVGQGWWLLGSLGRPVCFGIDYYTFCFLDFVPVKDAQEWYTGHSASISHRKWDLRSSVGSLHFFWGGSNSTKARLTPNTPLKINGYNDKIAQGEMENHLNHPPPFLETKPFIFQGGRKTDDLRATCGHLWRQHLGSSDVLGCWVVISPNAPAMMIPFKNRNSHKKNTGGNLRHSLQTTN